MPMSVQVIRKDGKPEWAVLPYDVYRRMVEEIERLQDARALDEAMRALDEGEELIPSEVVDSLLEGQNPIRVWRGYRGLTQRELAEAAGISVSYLSQLESGKRKGTTEVLTAIARALRVSLEDVVEFDR